METTPSVSVHSVDEFDRIVETGETILVDYCADRCGPCQALAPSVAAVATATGGWLRVVRVDVDAAPELAQRSDVREIPALHLYRDGRKVAALTGYRAAEGLLEGLVTHGLAWATATMSVPVAEGQPAGSWASRFIERLSRGAGTGIPGRDACEVAVTRSAFRFLESEDELAGVIDGSVREATALFLHDPWCPVSRRAYREMEQLGREVLAIDVSRHRQLSMEVERITRVRHESPQVIVLRDAIATWVASHGRVTASAIREALADKAVQNGSFAGNRGTAGND